LEALAKLDELHSKGVLNDSEFETEKARILEYLRKPPGRQPGAIDAERSVAGG
jgi:hypothetical protein